MFEHSAASGRYLTNALKSVDFWVFSDHFILAVVIWWSLMNSACCYCWFAQCWFALRRNENRDIWRASFGSSPFVSRQDIIHNDKYLVCTTVYCRSKILHLPQQWLTRQMY